jgi:hypothetical protein
MPHLCRLTRASSVSPPRSATNHRIRGCRPSNRARQRRSVRRRTRQETANRTWRGLPRNLLLSVCAGGHRFDVNIRALPMALTVAGLPLGVNFLPPIGEECCDESRCWLFPTWPCSDQDVGARRAPRRLPSSACCAGCSAPTDPTAVRSVPGQGFRSRPQVDLSAVADADLVCVAAFSGAVATDQQATTDAERDALAARSWRF